MLKRYGVIVAAQGELHTSPGFGWPPVGLNAVHGMRPSTIQPLSRSVGLLSVPLSFTADSSPSLLNGANRRKPPAPREGMKISSGVFRAFTWNS